MEEKMKVIKYRLFYTVYRILLRLENKSIRNRISSIQGPEDFSPHPFFLPFRGSSLILAISSFAFVMLLVHIFEEIIKLIKPQSDFNVGLPFILSSFLIFPLLYLYFRITIKKGEAVYYFHVFEKETQKTRHRRDIIIIITITLLFLFSIIKLLLWFPPDFDRWN